MNTPDLPSHPDCQNCDLCERINLNNPGLRSRIWDGGYGKTLKGKAVLIVGSHPGVAEDAAGRSFVGPTGYRTNQLYVEAARLDRYADCYLTNAIRCCPRDKGLIARRHLTACRQHLIADLQELTKFYSEVVILCTGSNATQSVLGKKATFATFDQGEKIQLGDCTVRVFSTFLATILLPGYDPSKVLAIHEHLMFLWRYLRDGYIRTRVRIPRRLVGDKVADPPPNVGLLSLDVETYGCCSGFPVQTCFHPRKSLHWDKVKQRDLVLTVGLSWRHPWTGALRSKVWRVYQPSERRKLVAVLSQVKSLKLTGMNLPFDMMYLRCWEPQLRGILRPGRCELHELSVVNFLENDQRTERGLKTLSLILNVSNYQTDPINLRKGQRYVNVHDPRLIPYQAKDTLSALICYETLVEFMKDRYGDATDKWTPYSIDWFNQLVWLAISMAENGIRYSRPRLWKVHRRYEAARQHVYDRAKDRWDVALGGTGSKIAADALFHEIIEKYAPDPGLSLWDYRHYLEQLEKTKSGEWSTKAENLNFLLGVVPPGHEDRGRLIAVRRYRRFNKIITSYTEPLLGLRTNREGSYEGALVCSMAHPRWYPVPSYEEDSNRSGGTRQGRMSAKDPAVPTQPPTIEGCQISRFPGGALVRADSSQIELRVAAMWSHDQEFMRIFTTDTNVHAATASLIKGTAVTKKGDPQWYHAGKTLNFLTLFFGGARKFQETLLREVGLHIPIRRCQSIIDRFFRGHPELRQWQDEEVARAKRDGYTELPLVGISRSFLGDVEATYVPTIVNFPVQAIAAMLTESVMFSMEVWLRDQGLRTLTVGNTYDEGIYDCPQEEIEVVCRKLHELFLDPPLYRDLIARGLAEVPLDVEVGGVYNDQRTFRLENGRVRMAA